MKKNIKNSWLILALGLTVTTNCFAALKCSQENINNGAWRLNCKSSTINCIPNKEDGTVTLNACCKYNTSDVTANDCDVSNLNIDDLHKEWTISVCENPDTNKSYLHLGNCPKD